MRWARKESENEREKKEGAAVKHPQGLSVFNYESVGFGVCLYLYLN